MKKSQHRRLRMPKAQLRRNRQLPQLRTVHRTALPRKLLRSPNRRLSRKPRLPEILKQERLTAENQAAQNPPRESDNSQEENSKQEIAELKGKVHALSVGVAADCIEDVLALAKAKVGGDVTLDKAIDSVIEKYPNFKGEKPPKAIVTSAVATVNDEQKTADEARINKIMGIK